ncbi:MAG: FG-GAP repeat domain-containing protein [Gemmatimonas sp.]|jgi:hypothetical protein|uniref:FG-GAP repeat domain-containing protein n=1 Tax=Gemmatimonas sp. TaxID=1962908 RepID=UPI00391F3617|nr:VCBS repeat-containing protein [Gemmatimonadota bacterium]
MSVVFSRYPAGRGAARHRCLVVLLVTLGCAGARAVDPPVPPSSPSAGPPFRLVRAEAGMLPGSVLAGRSMEAAMVDIDRDGDLDVVVAREFEAALILVNDGTGRFTDDRTRLPQVVRDYEDIAITDVDGDGDPDVVLVAEDDLPGTAHRLKHQLYLNDGAGRFTDASSRIPVCSDANAVVAGDLDGDGDPDLVLGNAGPELVLLNDGTGRFVESVGAIPASPDVTQDVVLGDVDGDSDLDLVIANESEGPNLLLLNDGRGRFAAAPTPLPTRATTEATRNASLADMDGDGDLDLVFANVIFAGGDPQARLLRNAGGGRFEDVTSAQLPPGVQHCIDLEFADIDRDGDSDLLGTSFPAAAVGLYLNDGRGRFTRAPAAIFPEPVVVQGVEVEVGDVNGDGHRDLYVATFIESADVLLLNRR